ncbi:MAG: cation diffusion facilitator family transporter [Cyclobacteriaceae bacterium]|nr:cation transporter [Cyclobacteriaceae bacterium]MCH8516947.1 cation diffusion facilitator family transporter [Cyclobacteriaceae bacterium]
MKNQQQRLLLISIAFFVSIFLVGVKFYAYFITKSNAILSDALESVINVLATGFAFYSIRLAALPKDRNHPYGHGKIEFFSAGIEGVLVIIAGFFIMGRSIYFFFEPKEFINLDFGGYIVLATMLVHLALGTWLVKGGEKLGSLTLVADGKHLLSDAASSLAIGLGVIIIHFTGWLWADSVLGIIFSFIIIYNGYGLTRKSVAGLMDEESPEVIIHLAEKLRKLRRDQWIDIHNLKVQRYGSMWHIDCHMTLPFYLQLNEVHRHVRTLENELNQELGREIEIFVHTDPCEPGKNCKICKVAGCEYRKEDFEENISWSTLNITKDERHHLKLKS